MNELHKKPMPQTIEAYRKLAERDLTVIDELRENNKKLKHQAAELKVKLNQAYQKIAKLKRQMINKTIGIK